MEKVKSFEDLLMAKTKIEYKDTPGVYFLFKGQIRTELGCTLSQVKKLVKEKNIKPIGVMRDTKVYYDIRDFAELCANGVA